MRQDDDLRDHFDPLEKAKHDRFRLNLRLYRKLRRKIVLAVFSLLVVALVPILFDRHLSFNTMHTIALGDFSPLGGFFGALPIVWPIGLFVMVYILVMTTRLLDARRRLRKAESIHLEKSLAHFDLVSFTVHVLAVYTLLNTFILSFAVIQGMSMEPTLHEGENVLLFHYDRKYERGDLLVVDTENKTGNGEFYIKRLIGLPNEVVAITEDGVTIDGTPLAETYLADSTPTDCPGGEAVCEFSLGPDEYFVLGDNRPRSEDSRDMGPFKTDEIYGRVTFRIRPVSRFGRVD